MFDVADELSWTAAIHAVNCDLARNDFDAFAAGGAMARGLVRLLRTISAFRNGRDDVWNDVPSALEEDTVSYSNVTIADEVKIMERRLFDRNAADLDRVQHCVRRQDAGSTDVDADFVKPGDYFASWKFKRNCTARIFPDEPERIGFFQIVNLDDDAVNFVADCFSQFGPSWNIGKNLV